MKNKKIIPLTITIVAVALVSILGLSKLFETGWLKENTVDNTLDADTENITEDSYFDYPYIAVNDFKSIDEIPSGILDIYYPTYIDESLVEHFYALLPKEDMLSFQDISNITGEFIKDSLGVVNHTNEPAIIIYDEYELEYPNYKYFYCVKNDSDNSKYNVIYYFTLDAITGEIKFLSSYDDRRFEYQQKGNDLTITKQEEENIINLVKDYLKLLGNDTEILGYSMQVTDSPYSEKDTKYYTVYMQLENNITYYYQMTIKENNGFWLTSYGRKVDFAQ